MAYDVDNAGRSRSRSGAPNQTDRLFVIVCVALWLAALGAAVAAIVALVDLAAGHPASSGDTDTPWLLYAVIGISAVVIAGAIPLLIRARRTASTGAPVRPVSQGESGPPVGAASAAPRLEPFGAPVIRRSVTPPATSRVGFPTAAVDQMWLRGTTTIVAAMGGSATAIGVATYLMASGHDSSAWIGYGVAAVIAVGMPVAAWHFLRELRAVIDSAE